MVITYIQLSALPALISTLMKKNSSFLVTKMHKKQAEKQMHVYTDRPRLGSERVFCTNDSFLSKYRKTKTN